MTAYGVGGETAGDKIQSHHGTFEGVIDVLFHNVTFVPPVVREIRTQNVIGTPERHDVVDTAGKCSYRA